MVMPLMITVSTGFRLAFLYSTAPCFPGVLDEPVETALCYLLSYQCRNRGETVAVPRTLLTVTQGNESMLPFCFLKYRNAKHAIKLYE